MKTEFQGRYYNGVSSKPYSCDIKLGEHVIVINIFNEYNVVVETIYWELEKVSKDDIEISNRIRLKYGVFPHQSVEIRDEDFSDSLHKSYPYLSFGKRDYVSVISRSWKWVLTISLILVGLGIFLFKAVIPGMAEYAAVKVPLSIEQSIGEAAYNQVKGFNAEDSLKSRLVQEFFDEINIEREYAYTITILNSETVNAFAVPGGRIVIYTGILNKMNKPEELAALLAHESSHIELQHSLKSIFRSLSGYFALSLLFGDMGGITAVVFENIYVFQDLQYSRKMEKEADIRGLKCMQESGINPEGMIGLFNTIKESDFNPDNAIYDLSEFVNTHPLTKHRIKYIQEYIDKEEQTYSNNMKLDSLFYLIKGQ